MEKTLFFWCQFHFGQEVAKTKCRSIKFVGLVCLSLPKSFFFYMLATLDRMYDIIGACMNHSVYHKVMVFQSPKHFTTYANSILLNINVTMGNKCALNFHQTSTSGHEIKSQSNEINGSPIVGHFYLVEYESIFAGKVVAVNRNYMIIVGWIMAENMRFGNLRDNIAILTPNDP